MKEPFFSIIVVCLNPGDKLRVTLESIMCQTFCDFEVIIKDGGSLDGSLAYAEKIAKTQEGEERKLKIVKKEDKGIYDAMNQASKEASGRFVYFLNCGDLFYTPEVLAHMWSFMGKEKAQPGIYYGDIYERKTGQRVFSNPNIDAFACYRNVPCHQACFYSREIFDKHCFDIKYRVRADYEQFLWCFLADGNKDKLLFDYHSEVIVDYEGGGFSETKANRKISAKEHKEITGKYLSRGQLLRFKMIMWLTLAPLRTHIAENEKTAKIYNRLKQMIYTRR
ncbi:MAG: glycosyltransferase [Lachnospiraceae bacterium]|nr:glycosyltransferase [Lachnospiraceae bacterium]